MVGAAVAVNREQAPAVPAQSQAFGKIKLGVPLRAHETAHDLNDITVRQPDARDPAAVTLDIGDDPMIHFHAALGQQRLLS